MRRSAGVFLVKLLTAFIFFSSLAHGAIHESDFENVNHSIFVTHAPIISRVLDGKLKIVELWREFGGAFKVDSTRKSPGEKKFIITLTGDIPQNRVMRQDGYAIVACHEVGHVLGGTPHQKKQLSSWSSVEGQADYFSTSDCMWRYIEKVKSEEVIQDFDRHAIAKCEKAYIDQPEKILGCLRIMTGIIALQNYFNATSSKKNPVNILHKDKSVVHHTLESYPSNQCRIDTMVAGLLKEPRPACWFAG